MPPNYADMTYFLEVAETLNISRAAERLGLTQPSLSSAIRRLEDSLGTELFLRGRSGVQLTRPGKIFVKKAQEMQHQWSQLKNEVLKEEHEAVGRYTLGAHPAVALYTLPHCLPDLLQQHKGLELKLVHDLSRKITEGIISFQIDFGIVVNPVRHPDLVITELCKDEVTLWTQKTSSSKTKGLPAYDTLICNPDLMQVQSIKRSLAKNSWTWQRVVSSGSLEVIAKLTEKGTGVGILPARVAAQWNLKRVEGSPLFKDKVCLVYRADMANSRASKLIAAAIRGARY